MATVTTDLRRQDDHRPMYTPYWMMSAEIGYADVPASNPSLLWSFPATKYGTRRLIIKNIAIQVITAFAGGTPSLNVGSWTIATDDAGDAGDTITVVDEDEYIPTADITEDTPAVYWAATGDWITAALLKTNAAPTVITPADTTVPCIGITGYASGSAGAARVFVQIEEVPFL